MPFIGEVYQIHPTVMVGPWVNLTQQHRGLVISVASPNQERSVIVAPMTGTKPSPLLQSHAEMGVVNGGLSPRMWVLCEYAVAVPGSIFNNAPKIGTLDKGTMAEVKRCLAFLYRIIELK